MDKLSDDFSRHLTRLGFEIGATREWVQQKLRRLLSEERHAALMKIINGPRGGQNEDAVYDFAQDVVEANLLRSMDPDVTLATSLELYKRCVPLIRPGCRIIELGCWTGALASFIASRHPQCIVEGVDRAARIIELDRKHYSHPNLAFQTWNYRQEKPETLEPSDVLLCGLGNSNLADGEYEMERPINVRQTVGYRKHKEDYLLYFRSWRSAAKPGGCLLAFLRILSTFGRFIAFLDAAVEAGWQPDFNQWFALTIQTTKERFPFVHFVAAKSAPVDIIAALDLFNRFTVLGRPYVQVASGVALALYETLNRRVLRSSTYTTPQGEKVHEETGIAGALGYVFTHDSIPQYKLTLIPVHEAEQHAKNPTRPTLNVTVGSGNPIPNNSQQSVKSLDPRKPR